MSAYKLEWNQADFIKQVKRDLVSNGEIVGEFVESEARKNLLNIQDPIWGRAYRSQIVARLIGYVVEEKSKEVDIILGVKKGAGGSHHGFYIELGSSKHSAHPFLRPAIFQNGREIVALLEGR